MQVVIRFLNLQASKRRIESDINRNPGAFTIWVDPEETLPWIRK